MTLSRSSLSMPAIPREPERRGSLIRSQSYVPVPAKAQKKLNEPRMGLGVSFQDDDEKSVLSYGVEEPRQRKKSDSLLSRTKSFTQLFKPTQKLKSAKSCAALPIDLDITEELVPEPQATERKLKGPLGLNLKAASCHMRPVLLETQSVRDIEDTLKRNVSPDFEWLIFEHKFPRAKAGRVNVINGTGEGNALVTAAVTAYNKQLPLIISPDVVYFNILQGYIIHRIKRKDACTGSNKIVLENSAKRKDNANWSHCATGDFEFMSFYEDNTKVLDKRMLAVCREKLAKEAVPVVPKNNRKKRAYTTSTPESVTAFNMGKVMPRVRSSYKLKLKGKGIPVLSLQGSKKDWESVLSRSEILLGDTPALEFWWTPLKKLLGEFVECFTDPSISMEGFCSLQQEFNEEVVVGGSMLSLFPFTYNAAKELVQSSFEGVPQNMFLSSLGSFNLDVVSRLEKVKIVDMNQASAHPRYHELRRQCIKTRRIEEMRDAIKVVAGLTQVVQHTDSCAIEAKFGQLLMKKALTN